MERVRSVRSERSKVDLGYRGVCVRVCVSK